MVRKQVYIEPAQERFLKQRARELGVTEADLIRRGIEQIARAPGRPVYDATAWAGVLAFLQRRAAVTPLTERWRWRRDDAYEERLGRLPG